MILRTVFNSTLCKLTVTFERSFSNRKEVCKLIPVNMHIRI